MGSWARTTRYKMPTNYGDGFTSSHLDSGFVGAMKMTKSRLHLLPFPLMQNIAPSLNEPYRTFIKHVYISLLQNVLWLAEISRSTTSNEDSDICKNIASFCFELVHLIINHLLAIHYVDIFRRYGPAYVWWLFAFERCKGEQEEVNLNGRDDGTMELTLMRNWITKHRLFELVSFNSEPVQMII